MRPHRTDPAAANERPLGTRYRLNQPDGTWWELGWDRPLGTFYAQHLADDVVDDEDLLAWQGTSLGELPTVDALAARLPIAIPEQIVGRPSARRRSPPAHVAEPLFLHLTQHAQRSRDQRHDMARRPRVSQ